MGETIRKIRKAEHKSLRELATLTGISKSVLGEIETGQYIANEDQLKKIADALEVKVEDLKYRARKYRI